MAEPILSLSAPVPWSFCHFQRDQAAHDRVAPPAFAVRIGHLKCAWSTCFAIGAYSRSSLQASPEGPEEMGRSSGRRKGNRTPPKRGPRKPKNPGPNTKMGP
jgi:hypothetical protein